MENMTTTTHEPVEFSMNSIRDSIRRMREVMATCPRLGFDMVITTEAILWQIKSFLITMGHPEITGADPLALCGIPIYSFPTEDEAALHALSERANGKRVMLVLEEAEGQ